jgi:hypothetical protein
MALGTTATVLAACDGTYDFPADRRWESTHFSYLTRASETGICPDVLGPLEEHFAVLQDYLGFEWPPGAQVTYEKMLDSADYEAHGGCPPDATACTAGRTVVSSDAMQLHELVHAYLDSTGNPPKVLVEGVAVVLSCTAQEYAQTTPTQSWTELASLTYGTAPDVEVYAAGAWLVGYLLRHYDPRLFTTVYQRLPDDADTAAMDGVFRDVYGDSLETIWAAARAEGLPHNACVWQCSRPPIPVDGTPVATEGVCGSLDAFHPFTLTSTSTVNVSTTASGVQLQSCDYSSFSETWMGPGALDLYELFAGTYFLESSPDMGMVAVDGSLSSVVAPTCAQATNVGPLQGGAGFSVYVPNTGTDWFVALPPPPAGKSNIDVTGGGALAGLCNGCDAASCVFPAGPAPAMPGQTLKAHTTSVGGPNSYSWITVIWY